MMPLDVNTFIGGVPYREVPHPEPAILVKVLAREGVRGAWVSDLPSAFAADPHPGNDALIDALAPHRETLSPVIAISGHVAGWERALAHGVDRGAVAVRAYGAAETIGPVAARCAGVGLPVMLTAHLEAASRGFGAAGEESVRAAVLSSPKARVIVTGAERRLIEASVASLGAPERARLWWEISRIAGPPADHLTALLRALGPERFLYGSGWPLRLTQVPKANLELLPPDLAGVHLADVRDLA